MTWINPEKQLPEMEKCFEYKMSDEILFKVKSNNSIYSGYLEKTENGIKFYCRKHRGYYCPTTIYGWIPAPKNYEVIK